MSNSTSRMEKENRKIINDIIKNLSKTDSNVTALQIEEYLKDKPNVPLIYNRFKEINKLYSKRLYQSYPEEYRDAIVNAIATYGAAYKTVPEIFQKKRFSTAQKLKVIDDKLKIILPSATHNFKKSLLSFQAQMPHQHLKQQFDTIIKILDNPDISNLEEWTDNVKGFVSWLGKITTKLNLAEMKEFTQKNVVNRPNIKQYIRNTAIYSQRLNEFIDTLDKVAEFKLANLIGNLKQQISNLDEYFIKINKDIRVIKRSKDPNAIKALSRLIEPIEKHITNQNSIQQFDNIKSILDQQNISSEENADKLSKTIAYLEQNIKNQNSITLDNIIALFNKYEHTHQIQPDSKSQNIEEAKTAISINKIIKEIKNLLRRLSQIFNIKSNNKKSNIKDTELSNGFVNKKQIRLATEEKANTEVKFNERINKHRTNHDLNNIAQDVNSRQQEQSTSSIVSNINNEIYDTDKVLTLKNGTTYILDEKNRVKAFQAPESPICFLTEQESIKFEWLNKYLANHDLNNIAQDVNSRQQEQPTSSLDHGLNEDIKNVKKVGINLQDKMYHPSSQSTDNSFNLQKFTSRRAFEKEQSKNNTKSR